MQRLVTILLGMSLLVEPASFAATSKKIGPTKGEKNPAAAKAAKNRKTSQAQTKSAAGQKAQK